MENDFSVSKLRQDIASIQAAGSDFKIEVARKYYRGSKIFSEVPVTYKLAVSRVLKYWYTIAGETEARMRSSKGSVGRQIIPYSDIRRYANADNDYASVVLFLDGLITGIKEDAITKEKDVTAFYNDVVAQAFKDGARSIGGILEELAELEADKVTSDEMDANQYDSMRFHHWFEPNDFMEIRKSVSYVIDFIVGSDIRDVPMMNKRPMLMSTCVSRVVDYITYTIASYAARVSALASYADGFTNIPVSEAVEFKPLESDQDWPIQREPFELAKATASLDNSGDLLNVMYDTIYRYGGDKLFKDKKIPTTKWEVESNRQFTNDRNSVYGRLQLPQLSYYICHGFRAVLPKEGLGNTYPWTIQPFEDGNDVYTVTERLNMLRLLDQTGVRQGDAIADQRQSHHQGRETLIRFINDLEVPSDSGEAMKLLTQLYGYTVTFITSIKTQVDAWKSDLKPTNSDRREYTASDAQEAIELVNRIYGDVGTAIGEKAHQLYVVLERNKQKRNSYVKGLFDLNTGTDMNDVSMYNSSLRSRFDSEYDNQMGYELPADATTAQRRKEERDRLERDNFLEVYAQPFYDDLRLYSEYVNQFIDPQPLYEADSKPFKDIMADAFNTFLALLRGLWQKVTDFFKNAKFIRAAAWVQRHRDELLTMNYAAVEVKVLNYKKDITLPKGFENIYKNMGTYPTFTENSDPNELSEQWVKTLYPDDNVFNWFKANRDTGLVKYQNLVMYTDNEQEAGSSETTLGRETSLTGQQINQAMANWIENVVNHETVYKTWENIQKSAETAIKTLKTKTEAQIKQIDNTAPVVPSQPNGTPPAQGGTVEQQNASAHIDIHGRLFTEADDPNGTSGTGDDTDKKIADAKKLISDMEDMLVDNKIPESRKAEYNGLKAKLVALSNDLKDKANAVPEIKKYVDLTPVPVPDDQAAKAPGGTTEQEAPPAVNGDGTEATEEQSGGTGNGGTSGSAGSGGGDGSGTGNGTGGVQTDQETGGTEAQQAADKQKEQNDKAKDYYQMLPQRATLAVNNLYTPVCGWICDMISEEYKYIQSAYNKAKGYQEKKAADNKANASTTGQNVIQQGV